MLPEMQPGDFGVVATTGWVARGIRLFTRSPYNHAFGYVGNGMIVEATPGGARLVHLSIYDKLPQLRSQLKLSPEKTQLVVKAYDDQIGVEYGFLDVAAIGLSSIGIVLSRLDDPDSRFCSQLVALGLVAGGVDLTTDKNPNRITPGDLAKLILMQPIPANW